MPDGTINKGSMKAGDNGFATATFEDGSVINTDMPNLSLECIQNFKDKPAKKKTPDSNKKPAACKGSIMKKPAVEKAIYTIPWYKNTQAAGIRETFGEKKTTHES